jgi:predicted TIM-barrel fold metal-dependent hydrolase
MNHSRFLKIAAFSVATPALAVFSSFTGTTISGMVTPRIIDSHLHVWASTDETKTFPFADGQNPPDALKDIGSTIALLDRMDAANVVGALIVQPINYKFDHSYVMNAIQQHPKRFKGMMLHNPALSADEAITTLEDLTLRGFVGVRFSPYLWPKTADGGWTAMSTPGGSGLAVYQRCAELNMPVGVMCFQGLQLHYDDIVELLKSSPKTTMILDHFGFTRFTEEGEAAFEQLLTLAHFPQIVIKISALFRLNDTSPYELVRKERFEPLLKAFGPSRLMFGTDFPYVLEQEPEKYEGMVRLVSSWMDNANTRDAVMGGTAEALFGSWETPSLVS